MISIVLYAGTTPETPRVVEKLHSEFVNEVELTVETIQPIELSEYTLSHPLTSYSVSTQYNNKNELAEGIIKISGSPGRNIIISMEDEIELKSTNFESLKLPLEVFWSGGQTGSVSEARRMAIPVPDISEFIIPLRGERYTINRKVGSLDNGYEQKDDFLRSARGGSLKNRSDNQKSAQYLGLESESKGWVKTVEEFYPEVNSQSASASLYLFIKPLLKGLGPVSSGVYEGEVTLNVDYVSTY